MSCDYNHVRIPWEIMKAAENKYDIKGTKYCYGRILRNVNRRAREGVEGVEISDDLTFTPCEVSVRRKERTNNDKEDTIMLKCSIF